MSDTYDIPVIGSGAGGARCAIWPSGKRILPLERGDWLTRERQTGWRKTCSSMALRLGGHVVPGNAFQPQVH